MSDWFVLVCVVPHQLRFQFDVPLVQVPNSVFLSHRYDMIRLVHLVNIPKRVIPHEIDSHTEVS